MDSKERVNINSESQNALKNVLGYHDERVWVLDFAVIVAV